MKDFYDIWLLSRQFEFDEDDLSKAIELTFSNRGTELPDVIIAFTDEFATAKQKQWEAFRKRLNQNHIPENFCEVVAIIKTFLTPRINRL